MSITLKLNLKSFKEFKKLIKKHKPNFIVGVPTLFENMTNLKHIYVGDGWNMNNVLMTLLVEYNK